MPKLPEVDWEEVERRLPIDMTPESRNERKKVFSTMDSSKNGLLTLTEVTGGISGIMGKDLIKDFDYRPAVKCAFACAQDLAPSKKKATRRGAKDSNIDIKEFHALILAFRKYCELAVLFKTLDKSGDARLSFKECEGSIPLLESWGFTKKEVRAKFPDEWTDCMKFDDFADWCILKSFGNVEYKLDDSDNEDVIIQAAAAEFRDAGGIVLDATTTASAKTLQEAQNARIVREEFTKYDKNGDGTISLEELSDVLKAINPKYTDDKIKMLFDAADFNKDGNIDHEEFCKWLFGK